MIDIKFSTIHLAADGRHLLNTARSKAYKCQLWIYNLAVASMQAYRPPESFVLGRRWRQPSKDAMGTSCMDKLGVVAFGAYDKALVDRFREAIQWSRDVRKDGVRWSANPPSRPELYPNMCRDAGVWQKHKRQLASELGDITQVWMCGPRHRERALREGIHSWRDSRLNSEILQIKGERGDCVDAMLRVNRSADGKVRPDRISENVFSWRKSNNEVFVDFETFNDVFDDFSQIPQQKPFNLIYQIGVGYMSESGWEYRYFLCKSPTRQEEFRIMQEFQTFLDARSNPDVYYWHAEESFWARSCADQFDYQPEDKREQILSWSLGTSKDLRKLFVKEPIVIKGCFGFGLKQIGRSLKDLGLIDTPLESECSNGRTAMVQAWRCYKNFQRPWNCGAMMDVIQYNEYDCRLLCDVLNYLRQNH